MSRSGYSDDLDAWDLIRWRGAVASAIKGKRGQEFLREMLAALDALPEKRLIANELVVTDSLQSNGCCALGAVAISRGMDVSDLDPEDRDRIAEVFGIAPALAAEIVFENDGEWGRNLTPELRFERMRAWVIGNLRLERGEA